MSRGWNDQVMVLDFDPEVVAFSSQSFQLLLGVRGEGRVRHIPDFFAWRCDGSAVVIDVRADDRIEPKDAAVFAATEGVCVSAGWSYRRVGVLDPVFAANLRWLAGYRQFDRLPRSGETVYGFTVGLYPMLYCPTLPPRPGEQD